MANKKNNQIEREIKISYRWWKNINSDTESVEINSKHIEALEESAMDRITHMMSNGYTSGELVDNICMNEDDPETGIDYSGWWEVTKKSK
jgi:hypothetical protein